MKTSIVINKNIIDLHTVVDSIANGVLLPDGSKMDGKRNMNTFHLMNYQEYTEKGIRKRLPRCMVNGTLIEKNHGTEVTLEATLVKERLIIFGIIFLVVGGGLIIGAALYKPKVLGLFSTFFGIGAVMLLMSEYNRFKASREGAILFVSKLLK